MSKYLLKISGSNEIVNIVEWNGSGSLNAPTGYEFQAFVTESTDFINYVESASLDTIPVFSGKLFGQFQGELTGSITIEGETIDNFINKTPYGTLTLHTSSLKNIFVKSGSFKMSGSNLYLPLYPNLNDKYTYIENYSSSFAGIISGSIKNYIFSLENECLSFDFLIKNTQVTSSISSSLNNDYFELEIEKYSIIPKKPCGFRSLEAFDSQGSQASWLDIFDKSNKLKITDKKLSDLFGSDFNVNFNFGNKSIVTDNIILGGKKIENVLSNTTPYGMLQYKYSEPDTGSIYGWNRFAGRYQFTFDSGNFWTSSKTTRVQMHIQNWPTEFDPDYPNVNPYSSKNYSGNFLSYLSKMLEIIKFNQIDTTLNFTSVKYPDTKKVFKIKKITFYTPTFTGSNTSQYNANEWNFDQYLLTWNVGKNIAEYTDAVFPTYTYNGVDFPFSGWTEKYSIFDDPTQWEYAIDALSNQRQKINPSVFYPAYDPTNVDTIINWETFSQYDLEVEEIYSSTGSNDPAFYSANPIPMDGELFHIDINSAPTGKRKKVEFVSSSKNIIVPDWTSKIDIVCVGAGGGGGGGASGYAHTGSAPFLDPLQDYRDAFLDEAIIGTPGNYTPRQDTFFGHEFVTGGGGGAGGCVAIESITGNNAINARGKNLSLTIGTGGNGGSGSSYFDDVVALQGYDGYPENFGWNVLEEITSGPFGITSFPGLAYKQGVVAIISPYEEKYHGKPGGDTIAVLDNKIVTRAQGGNGGTAGFSLKKYFSPFHRLSESPASTPTGFAFVPGGANDGTTNLGSEIRIGGAGGYGMSMPDIKKSKTLLGSATKEYPTANVSSQKAANAPNFEWGKFDSTETDVDMWKLPYGNTTRTILPQKEYLKYKKTGYNITNTSAPLGGGGGVGASYQGIDQRSLSIYSTDIERFGFNKLYGYTITVPNDYFQYTSNIISSSIRIGLGGKTLEKNNPLIDVTDEYGVNYKWEFSEGYSGGRGGYGAYGLWVDTAAQSPWSFNGIALENLQPQSGSNFPTTYVNAPYYESQAASGGGGGAGRYVLNYEDKYRQDNEALYPTRGQNGASGGNGFAIIVFEE